MKKRKNSYKKFCFGLPRSLLYMMMRSGVANKDAEFEIKTKGEPIYMRPRPLTPATLAAVNEEVKKLLRMG